MAKKILVIDDDPIVVTYLTTLFQDHGYDTCTAGTGYEGMDVLRAENPDLITLDLEMPDEWGTRFYRKMRKDDTFKHLPVLIISGMPSRHLSVRGAIGYLHKPFEPDEVIRIVQAEIGEA